MADAVETLGEDVGEEAADELADVERHGGVAAGSLDPIVLDLERDGLVVERDQAAVGSDLSGCSRLVLEAVAVEPAVISREFRLPASTR
jgi:hypothetical protein